MTSGKTLVATGMIVVFMVLTSPAALAQSVSGSMTREIGNSMIGGRLVQTATMSNSGGIRSAVSVTEGHVRLLGGSTRVFTVTASCRRVGSNPATCSLRISGPSGEFIVERKLTRTLTVFQTGMQLFIGPIPVHVSGAVSLSFSAHLSASVSSGNASVDASFAGGLNVTVTAAAGIPVAYIGIEGSASPLTTTLNSSVTLRPTNIRVLLTLNLSARAEIAVVIRLLLIHYRHVIASWNFPFASWTILDRTL